MSTAPFQWSGWIKLSIITATTALLGLACVIVPPLFLSGALQDTRPSDAPLFPVLWTAISRIRFGPTMLSLFCLGLVVGALQPKFWWVVGVAPLALPPMATMLEVIVAPKSHNLLGIEFGIYAFIALASFVGAFLGSRLRLLSHARIRSSAT
jgi:hypothetical protein